MKKIRNLLMVLLSVALFGAAFALTACVGRNEPTHTHTYSAQWSYDENYHWHKATCEHTSEINGRAAHSFNENVCSVCGYEKSGTDKPDNPQKVFKTVSFNLNGGNGSLDDMQFAVGEVMSTLPSPTRDGYTFICWEIPFIGEEYTAASVMPNRDLQLTARWEKVLSGYSDNYVSFKPSSEGVKDAMIREMYRGEVDKFVYVEITSDDLGGIANVGKQNNFNLRTLEGMQYAVKSGYTWAWYQGNFDTPNGAQRFTLRYGSNIQFVTISDNSGVVQQTYLLDIYVKHDYYISLYKNIFEQEPYDRVRVIENDRFSADTKISESSNFEFDSRVYFNTEKRTYEKFVYSTAITKNWDLYQTYKPITIEAELNEGVIDEDLIITPYTQYFTLPSPEKAGYDFLGWQLANGEYLTNVQGYSGTNYISEENNPEKLTAIYVEKRYYYTFENDTLNTFKTVPIVTYTDKTMRTILDIEYTPYNTDCVVPVKTAQGNNEIFTEWLYYYLSDKGEFSTNLSAFDFDKKIVSPIALAPNTSTTNDYVVPLNGELTSRETGNYRMYLPANKRYQLTISSTSSVTLTINQYGSTSNSRTLTVRSGSPQTVNLDYYVYNLGSTVYSHGYVTFKVTSLNGSFTAKLVGSTAGTSGTPVVTNENNTANVGEDFTVPLVKPGYAFDGWYENDTKISENEFITTQDREMEITAKWVVCPIALEKSIAEAGTVSGVSGTTAIGEEVTITAATKNGYTWVGWYNGNALLTKELEYTFTMPAENATYTAKWIKITVDRNLTSAGSVSSLSKAYTVGDEATVTATTNNGYTWLGWYNGEVELSKDLSYTFKMPSESATYTAKWAKLTLARNNSSAGSISSLNAKYTVGQEVTITATTNNGYTFLGWYNGETLLSTNANYTFEMPAENVTYTATWTSYTLTTARSDNNAGTVTTKNAVKTTAGQEVTITATTNNGYTFLGWYNGETLLSTNANYTFEMPFESVTYTATWTSYTLTTARNDSNAGTVTTKNAVKTTAGQEVTITATTNDGYTFVGWYNGDTLLSANANYTFEMPAENVTYTAKWTSYTLTVINTTGGKVNPSAKNQATIAFNLNGASGTTPASQTITKTNGLQYPAVPTRSGYVFAGWYTNSTCTGSPFDFTAVVTDDTVLYAKWISYSGTGVLDINASKSVSVVSKDNSSKRYYAFVPLVSEQIEILSSGSLDTYGYLYDSNKKQLAADDDSAGDRNFKIVYQVEAGKLYYISPCGYNGSGSTTVIVKGSLPQVGGKLEGELNFAEPQKMTAGNSVELKAVTNNGYTFVGWYNGEEELSKNIDYMFVMPQSNTVLTAKWIVCPITLEKNIAEAGNVSGIEGATSFGTQTTISATTNAGYTWLGWYIDETLVTSSATHTFTINNEQITYTAKWVVCPVSFEKNIEEAGVVQGITGGTAVGEEVSVSATTNAGYTWLGWYDGDTLLTSELEYTFAMPAENVVYTAKWACYTLTTQSSITGAGNYTVKNEEKIKAGDSVSVSATTNAGYTWLGWYNGEILLTREITYDFEMPTESVVYTAKWIECKAKIEKNNDNAGTVSGLNRPTVLGENITITATTNAGYTWLGWYNGDSLLTSDLEHTFSVTETDIVFTAKWSKVTLTINDPNAGTVSELSETYVLGQNVTIEAITNKGYTWLGWYDGDTKLTGELSYTFEMPIENLTYTAKWTFYTVTVEKSEGGNVGAIGNVTIHYNLNGGRGDISDQVLTINDNLPYPAMPTKSGYVFRGWFVDSNCTTVFDFSSNVTESMTLHAGWTQMVTSGYRSRNIIDIISNYKSSSTAYSFSTTNTSSSSAYYTYFTCLTSGTYRINYKNGASSSNYGTYTYIYNVTQNTVILANTNISSTSYASVSFEGNAGDVIYIRNYKYSSATQFYLYITGGKMPNVGGVSTFIPTKVTVGEQVTLEAISYEGYTWLGWYDGETKLADELSYTFEMPAENLKYTPRWTYYTLTTEQNDSNAGRVTSFNQTKTTVGQTKTITASTYSGYTWLGWYNGENKLTDDLSYTFVMPAENLTYTAKWIKVKIERNNTKAGFTTSLNSAYKVGDSATITATTNRGYTWLGWYNGENKLTDDLSYTFVMPAENATYIAKWKVCDELNNFIFTSTQTSVTITGIIDKTVTSIVLPDYVTSIAQGAFSGCSNVTDITLPFVGGGIKTSDDTYQYPFGYIFGTSTYDGAVATKQSYYGSNKTSIISSTYYIPSSLRRVTILGGNILYGAFYNCNKLTNVDIPSTIDKINASAFYGCSSLTTFMMSKNIASIGANCFYGCNGMTSVYFNGSLDDWFNILFSGTDANPVTFGHKLYINNVLLTSLTVPSSIVAVPNYIFSGCTSITNITLHENVTSIGDYAFAECNSFTSLTIPQSVTTLGVGMLKGCAKLSNLTIPFVGASIDVHNGATSVFGHIFGYFKHTSNVNATYNGGTYQYYNNSGSTTEAKCYYYYIPSSLKKVTVNGGYINDSAFWHCNRLTEVVLSDGVGLIGDNAFDGCSALSTVSIPSSVVYIGLSAFKDCTSLTSITIPNGVIGLGGSVFSGCTRLSSVSIPNSIETLGDSGTNVFYQCNSLKYTSYNNAQYIGNTQNPYLVLVKASNTSITTCTVHSNTKIIMDSAFSGCTALTTVSIPNGIVSIGIDAFYNCDSLKYTTYNNAKYLGNTQNPHVALMTYTNTNITSCTIHANTKVIGRSAFSGCTSLKNITIPNNVVTIGSGAFAGATALTSVNIGSNVKSINAMAFYGCTSITSMVLPSSVKIIDRMAFEGTKIESITLNSNIQWIGDRLLFERYGVDITFDGSKAQWLSVCKHQSWAQRGRFVIHCTDGDINVSGGYYE